MLSSKRLLQSTLIALYAAAILLPPYVFFHDRGGAAFLRGLSPRAESQLVFPLLGLYAFTFVTWQVLVATNLRWLRKLWPRVVSFHRFQGSFALLFAVLHPTFIAIGFGIANYLHLRYTAPQLRIWTLPAYLGLTIMIATVLTAILAWYGRNIPWWRKLHRLNYLVFALVWTHSWFIGTDTHTPFLRRIWVIYLAAVLISVYGKYRSKLKRLTRKETYA